jgi:carbon starvation protein
LLVLGLAVAGFTGATDLQASAPAIAEIAPSGAPPIMPFLFITIACGAVSGFHCVVSSGTSSKQISCETDAQYVGYGAMLLEGALAVIVILACCAGLGMGVVGEGGEVLRRWMGCLWTLTKSWRVC